MFTKRHYKAIAKILSDEITSDDSHETYVTVYNIATQLADYFEHGDNPRFDCERFMLACGMEADD